MSKKIKVIIFILILCVIALSVLFFKINKAKYEYTLKEIKIEDVNYYTLTSGDKFGVIDKSGNIVIEPKYAELVIPDPTQDLYIVRNEASDTNFFAIDKNEQKIFADYESVEPIAISLSSSLIPYEKEVLRYKVGNLYGLLDATKKEKITEPIYEEISAIAYKEGCLQIKKDGKYGAINIKGTILLDPIYDNISTDGYYDEDTVYKNAGFKVRTKTDEGYRYGYANKEGKMILQPIYNDINRITEIKDENNVFIISALNGRFGVQKNGKELLANDFDDIEYNDKNKLLIVCKNNTYGVYGIDGKVILPMDYDSIFVGGEYISATKGTETLTFNNQGTQINTGFISYNKVNDNSAIVIDEEGNYNIVDNNNKRQLTQDYVFIDYFTNGLFIATQESSGLIKANGDVVVDCKYNSMQILNDANAIQATDAEDRTYIISCDGSVSEGIQSGAVLVTDSYIRVYSDTETKWFDLNGKEVTYKNLFPNKTLYAKKENGKWGFVDKNGNVVVDCKYDMVTEENENVCGIKENGKWGVIDNTGKVIVEPKYNIAWNNVIFLGKYYRAYNNLGVSTYTDDEE